MTSKESNPPKLALWWLKYMCPSPHKEALTGDLIERFREGATHSWFWRQVLIACVTGVVGEIRRRWAFFCYAAAGTIAMCFMPMYARTKVPTWLHWSDLPWPVSQFVFELSAPALVTLAALFVLAAGLLIGRSFRWVYLFRTWAINLALLTIGNFLIPLLLRDVPGDSSHKILIIPGFAQLFLLGSTFLVAAWLGCPMAQSANRTQQARQRMS